MTKFNKWLSCALHSHLFIMKMKHILKSQTANAVCVVDPQLPVYATFLVVGTHASTCMSSIVIMQSSYSLNKCNHVIIVISMRNKVAYTLKCDMYLLSFNIFFSIPLNVGLVNFTIVIDSLRGEFTSILKYLHIISLECWNHWLIDLMDLFCAKIYNVIANTSLIVVLNEPCNPKNCTKPKANY